MLKQVAETLAELRPRPIGPEGLVGDLRPRRKVRAPLRDPSGDRDQGTEDLLPPPQREVVNSVREALTNVRKHSGRRSAGTDALAARRFSSRSRMKAGDSYSSRPMGTGWWECANGRGGLAGDSRCEHEVRHDGVLFGRTKTDPNRPIDSRAKVPRRALGLKPCLVLAAVANQVIVRSSNQATRATPAAIALRGSAGSARTPSDPTLPRTSI